jgi:TorA maturation chaperone TorD
MELLRVLGAVVEAPGSAQARLAEAAGLRAPPVAAEHTELFRLRLPPYASLYLGREGLLGGEARDRVAGFWRALGAVPPPEPDHLTVLLAAHASLVEHETVAGHGSPWRAARHGFFWEHLASWLPPYLARVAELGQPFHREWAAALAAALGREAEALGPPVSPPAALVAAPALDAAADEDPLAALLAPARSGVILTRADLAEAAAQLGLGLRQGERLRVLSALVRQDPRPVLRWLASEALRQADGLASGEAGLAPVVGHWRSRAASTARVLGALAEQVPLPTEEAVHA